MDCLDWFENESLVVERTKKSIEDIACVENEWGGALKELKQYWFFKDNDRVIIKQHTSGSFLNCLSPKLNSISAF